MTTTWWQPVDYYCERTDASFWAEPVNAITNVAFLLAAAVAFVQWRRHRGHDLPTLTLIVITGLIAFGSFAFHTLATRGAVLLDVVPIAVFVYGYLLLALRRFLRVPMPIALAIVLVFVGSSQALDQVTPDAFLNGSGEYLLPLAALIIVGLLTVRDHGWAILLAAAVFTISLVFRSIDQAICAAFPLGTHFVWHLLNALVLYILLQTALSGPEA